MKIVSPKPLSGSPPAERRKVTVQQALGRLPGAQGETFVSVFENGGLMVEMVAPPSRVPLPPHTRDEAYVIVRGNGELISDGDRVRVEPGDFLFVPAGMQHHFENFTDDLALWAVFYGPEGGEAKTSP